MAVLHINLLGGFEARLLGTWFHELALWLLTFPIYLNIFLGVLLYADAKERWPEWQPIEPLQPS